MFFLECKIHILHLQYFCTTTVKMQILLWFLVIFLLLNESIPVLNKDGISPTKQIEFREMVTKQRNQNFLAKPYAFRKMVKNHKIAKQKDQKFFNYQCAWSQEPLTLEHLNNVCGLRMDSYDYGNVAKTAKIVNGTDAVLGEWPWQAKLDIPLNESLTEYGGCGGALITDDVILTAAHCIPVITIPASYITIMLGGIWKDDNRYEESKEILRAKHFKRHEKYTKYFKLDDIALVWLERKVQFNCYIAPVCLPIPPGPFLNDKLVDAIVWVAGFGLVESNGTAPDRMLNVQLVLLSNKVCEELESNYTIYPSQICSYREDKDTCQGDSGGPLVLKYEGRWTTVAAVSYGIGCAQTAGVNTRVTSFLSWIKSYVDIFDEDKRSTKASSK